MNQPCATIPNRGLIQTSLLTAAALNLAVYQIKMPATGCPPPVRTVHSWCGQ